MAQRGQMGGSLSGVAATTLQAWIKSASRRFVEVQIAIVLPAIADVMAPRSDAPRLRPNTERGGSGDVEPVVAAAIECAAGLVFRRHEIELAATQGLDGTVGEEVPKPARVNLVGASPPYTMWREIRSRQEE